MLLKLALLVLLAGATLVPPAAAAATNGGGKSEDTPGQPIADERCDSTIARQGFYAGGQTGAQTGSAQDSKQFSTAVANCDHFLQQQF